MSFGGPTSHFSVEDDAGPYLQELVKEFPKEYSRALRHVAWLVTRRLKAVMRSGTLNKRPLPPHSKITQHGRIERLKSGTLRNLKKRVGWVQYELTEKQKAALGRIDGAFTMISGKYSLGRPYNVHGKLTRKKQYIPDAFLRWGKPTRQESGLAPRMARFIRYKKISPLAVAIGAQNSTTARYLEAIQAGKRGSRGVFEYLGRQKVTPAMRRMFFAAGIPLRKNAELQQKPRPFVREVFDTIQPELSDLITDRIKAALHGLTGEKMDKINW